MTPVKHECDATNLSLTLARSKILLMEKLMNGALVTPKPYIALVEQTEFRAILIVGVMANIRGFIIFNQC